MDLVRNTQSETIYRIVCHRETGVTTISTLIFRKREGAQDLADSLNKKFSHRRYFVQSDDPKDKGKMSGNVLR